MPSPPAGRARRRRRSSRGSAAARSASRFAPRWRTAASASSASPWRWWSPRSEHAGAGRGRAHRDRIRGPAGRGRGRRGAWPTAPFACTRTCRTIWRSTMNTAIARAPSRALPRRRMSCASSLRAQRIAGNPMEPKSCVALYDAASDAFELCLPMPGRRGYQGGARAHHRPRPEQLPHPLGRCRRRLRHPERGLSGIPGPDAGGQADRAAGEMDRHPLGDDVRRSSRARGRSDAASWRSTRRAIPRAARAMAGQSRRLLLRRRAR